MKRIIAVLIVAFILIQCLPIAAFASDDDGPESNNVDLATLESYLDSLTAKAEQQIYQIDEYFTELGELAKEFDGTLSVFETGLFSLSWEGKTLTKEDQDTLLKDSQNISSVVIDGINTRRDSRLALLNAITPEQMSGDEYKIYSDLFDSLSDYAFDLVTYVRKIDKQLLQEIKDSLEGDNILAAEEFNSINAIVGKLSDIKNQIMGSEPEITPEEELAEWVEIYKQQTLYNDQSDSQDALTEQISAFEFCELYTKRLMEFNEKYGKNMSDLNDDIYSSFVVSEQDDTYSAQCSGGFVTFGKTDLTIESLTTTIMDLDAEEQEGFNVILKALIVISALEMNDLEAETVEKKHDIDPSLPEDVFMKYLDDYTNIIHPAIAANVNELEKGEEILVYQGNYDYYAEYHDYPDVGKMIYLFAEARE